METVFQALADPTRRRILERLRLEGPRTLTELAQPLPISRQAVTKHLDGLTACGLVRVERRGRERLHRLEAGPLRELERWLAPYAEFWDDRLERLRRHLDRPREEP